MSSSKMRAFYRRVSIPLIVSLLILLPLVSMAIAVHSQPPASINNMAFSVGSGIASRTACDNATCIAHSNATLSEFYYTETSHTFNLSVTGNLDTTGYVNITVPKSIVSNPSQITVFANGNRVSGSALTITSSPNSYFLYFTINFSNASNSNLAATIQPYLIVGAVASVSLVILYLKTRRSNPNPSIDTRVHS